jgi:hypothetical protein
MHCSQRLDQLVREIEDLTDPLEAQLYARMRAGEALNFPDRPRAILPPDVPAAEFGGNRGRVITDQEIDEFVGRIVEETNSVGARCDILVRSDFWRDLIDRSNPVRFEEVRRPFYHAIGVVDMRQMRDDHARALQERQAELLRAAVDQEVRRQTLEYLARAP